MESASLLPLAFAIVDPVQGLATGTAAETGRLSQRLGRRFIATWPVAQNHGKKIFAA
jgi:hypothetical protein